jgi:hypothetical protein
MYYIQIIKGIIMGTIFSIIDNLIFIYEDFLMDKYTNNKIFNKLNIKEKYLIIGAFSGIISLIISKIFVDRIYKKYSDIKTNIYGDVFGMIIGLIIVLYFYHIYLKENNYFPRQH